MTDEEWSQMIGAIPSPSPIEAHTYRNKKWASWSSPAVFQCNDGAEYVVKSPRIGPERARAIVTEQIVSHLGIAMGSPVAQVRIVNLPDSLISAAPGILGHLGAGLAHGSKRIPDCSERAWLQHTDFPENRSRFAAIAVLYGWTVAKDEQLIYRTIPPPLVYSTDHGFFFGGGQPPWTIVSLGAHPNAQLYPPLVGPPCSLTDGEIAIALDRLGGLGTRDLAEAVSKPPESWGITIAERVAIAQFLDRRRIQLLATPLHNR